MKEYDSWPDKSDILLDTLSIIPCVDLHRALPSSFESNPGPDRSVQRSSKECDDGGKGCKGLFAVLRILETICLPSLRTYLLRSPARLHLAHSVSVGYTFASCACCALTQDFVNTIDLFMPYAGLITRHSKNSLSKRPLIMKVKVWESWPWEHSLHTALGKCR